MIIHKYDNVSIKGIAAAVPSKTISINSFKSSFGDEVVEKFAKMTGIKTLHQVDERQTASDLGYEAAVDLLKHKHIEKDTIGSVIFVSQSPDYKIPATACVLHKRLGMANDCLAYDINLGCSGYVYGLQIACACIQKSNIKRVLLITGDTVSKMISPQDRSCAMLFGDAGSATLLEKEENSSDIIVALRTIGASYRSLIVQGGGYRNPDVQKDVHVWEDGNLRSSHHLYMNGTDVFNFSISEVPTLINDFIQSQENTYSDYDCLVLHQANLYILKQIAKMTKFSMEKVPLSIGEYGNTSVTSIPLTLSKCFAETTRDAPLNSLMCGFGIGLSLGVVSAGINVEDIFPVVVTDNYYTEGGIQRD